VRLVPRVVARPANAVSLSGKRTGVFSLPLKIQALPGLST
jgi:hypothetical protein